MVGPMDRPSEPWYSGSLDEISKEFDDAIKKVNRSNVSKIGSLVRTSQVFDEDLTHLTLDAGKKFIETILYFAGEYFDATLVEFDEETDMEITTEPAVTNRITDESGPIASGSGETSNIETRVTKIEMDTKARNHNDSMVTARIREEIDWMMNVKKEDKLIVTGFVSQAAMPTDRVEKKNWLNAVAGEALNFLVAESADGIQFVTAGRQIANGLPTMLEVKMRTREMAINIRKEYAKKKKEKIEMGNLFVANSVTLATRVRTDILKAIGTKCSNAEFEMFVVGFTSRPVLQVKRKDGSGQSALTFADAVAKFGRLMSRGDLQQAYGRAGTSFAGQMQQNFVVLHDRDGGMAVQRPESRGVPAQIMGGGKKRQLESPTPAPAKRTYGKNQGKKDVPEKKK
jgi:hypothetical protein